tara:strand:+ start:22529 stop:25420 length:2892 start_codon:yes stop_codon:yes gene_type:complete
MRLQSNNFLYLLLDKWRGNVAAVTFDGSKVSASRPLARSLQLSEIRTAPVISRRWIGSELSVETAGTIRPLRIRSRDQGKLQKVSNEIDRAWRDFNISQWHSQKQIINRVIEAINELNDPKRYPSACLVEPILVDAQHLEEQLFSKLNKEAIGNEAFNDIERIRTLTSAPRKLRAEAIAKFEIQQLEIWSDFFDTFEKNPLTPEQRLSVISDEDATLVLAGAGSGKTSVITAKAGYLIKAGIRNPEEILLLAFARDAAAEMSERIAERCGEPVEARTFHALSYTIIGEVESGKPALAAHATDDKAFLVLIKDIVAQLAATASDASKAIMAWFTSDRLEDKSEWDFKKKHDYYTHLEKEDLRTLQGEKVNSYEEVLIANWLYENGVEYEYEPDYEHDTSDPTKRNYCPDFRLTESGVYLEHFGVRRKLGPNGEEILNTAPWIDRTAYLEGMAWKRQVHEEHETTLIETYSYERQEGRLLEALSEKIAQHVTIRPRPRETLFDRVVEMKQVDSFIQLLANFLRNYKSGGYSLDDCEQKATSAKLGRRARAFLTVFGPVYSTYQEKLGSRIDFEDMVLRAAHYVETNRYRSPFGHILVDEFQDISRSRARLVKALLNQREDARLFAVGDDWQSIYRFAGSDVHLMRNFGKEFGGTFDGEVGVHRTVDLGRTFRSVDKIAFAARNFVLKNPTQLVKTVIPAATTTEPAIHVVSAFQHNVDQKLDEVLSRLEFKAKEQHRRASVLLLGRYRHSAPDSMNRFRSKHPELDITFKTIHSSKGLEADHVVLLQLNRGRTGFPSEIVDDPLLTMVSPEAEPFAHAEERRVMYVAMTRARESLTLVSSAARPSEFVAELKQDPAYELGSDDDASAKSQICGECQGQLFPVPKRDGGTYYRCEHTELCGNSISACAACDCGFPVRSNGDAKCECGQSYKACPICADGWLIERSGRYGKFLSCVKFPRCAGKSKF